MRRRWGWLVAWALPLAGPLQAQVTAAERTGFRETSSHADVLAFLDSLQRAGASIRVARLATSAEGREIPLVVAARPMVAGPAEAHRSEKPIVYLQANIHAGEVEGKEALQMLLRDLTVGPLRPLLDSLVVLAVPIYNADGNDLLGPGDRHRPGQSGPPVVGRRPNGQGLDLNRDYVKMEAPETRGAAAMIAEWDPDLLVDLHTTNGSYHGYALTYASGLNPNGGAGDEYVRSTFLPAVRERMRRRHGMETFSYGNFLNQEPDSLAQGWVTYDPRPRFGTNWFGMRGRLAILSEAYSNAPFADRVAATYAFVREILSLTVEQRRSVKAIGREADRHRPDSLAVRSRLGPGKDQDVIAEITRGDGDGSHGFARRIRTGAFRTIRMPVYDHFVPARREALPAAYLLPARLRPVVDLLRRHGVPVERLNGTWEGELEAFRIDSISVGPLFEGHRTVSVEGAWLAGGQPLPAVGPGWYHVGTAGRLGRLAAYLLEPASEDGVATWNLLDRDLRPGGRYPILRARTAPAVPATAVP